MLVWLAGDARLIREDAGVFFRRADEFDEGDAAPGKGWQDSYSEYPDSSSATDADETDYVAALRVINEFLPVKELAARPIHVPTLQRFGLVKNETLDRFLAVAFGNPQESAEDSSGVPNENRVRTKARASKTNQ